jgi:hypothetical protein
MKMTLRLAGLGMVASCFCGVAEAQDRTEVRGIVGRSAFGDDSVVIGHNVVGLASDIRLTAGLRVGGEIAYHNGPGADRDFTILPIVGYDFRRGRKVVPFLSGGVGVLLHDNGRRWTNSASFGFGAGAKVFLSDRLFIAPEFRVGWDPAARAIIGVGYRF